MVMSRMSDRPVGFHDLGVISRGIPGAIGQHSLHPFSRLHSSASVALKPAARVEARFSRFKKSVRAVRDLGVLVRPKLLSSGGRKSKTKSKINRTDCYQFSLRQASDFQALLSQAAATTSLLVFDTNRNARRDSGELVKALSRKSSKAALTTTIPAGNYFVEVKSSNRSSKTHYSLSLAANANAGSLPTDPGNSLGAAYGLGAINSFAAKEYVGKADSLDYYQFTLAQFSRVSATLSGAVISLCQDVNKNGAIESGERLLRSTGTASQSLAGILPAGSYFLEVQPRPGTAEPLSAYTLSLTTEARLGNLAADPGATPTTAHSLGGLSSSSGVIAVQEFISTFDPVDYYSFVLSTKFLFSANIVGESATAFLDLIYDANNNTVADLGETIATSSGSSSAIRPIFRGLLPGNYFIKVQNAVNSNTSYNLTLELE